MSYDSEYEEGQEEEGLPGGVSLGDEPEEDEGKAFGRDSESPREKEWE